MDPALATTAKKPTKDVARPVTDALTRFVGNTYLLYFQTQSFHWNVRGPHFAALHELFGAQYEELADAIDTLAERVRALGAMAPTSLAEILRTADVAVDHGAPSAPEMIGHLLRANEQLARAATDCAALADEAGDPVTNDMLVTRAAAHDKAAWMLRALREE